LRFIVLQPGARMSYAVPALLARAGMLARFYTDICADVGLLRYLGPIWPQRLRPKPVARLLGRRLPGDVPRRSVRHSPIHALTGELLRRLRNSTRRLQDRLEPSLRLIDMVRADKCAGANALYTAIVNADLDFVQELQSEGIRIVHDVFMNPLNGLIIQKEREIWPEIEKTIPKEQILAGIARDAEKYRIADLILVPSDSVYQAVIRLGADPARVAQVPYGIEERWHECDASPVPGRVMFVGKVCLNKGSHYLAEAARILRQRRVQSDVRVVGPYDPAAIARPEFRGPTYVGQVPRSRVADEFRTADVFVLPTLSEGMARVHLEAMACGVPVITTPNCGSVVRDGVDGFIVPIRDAAAIADKVELLLTDRELRARMGRSARERAREFTWQRYGERLLGALGTLAA
jgi:glycosyltransferase involved in cell wall biosynthesis